MSTARAASQRRTEHGHRKSTAILDACFHTDMNELIHVHPPRETEPEGIVVWLLFKAHSGARRAAQAWQEYFRKEVSMRTGGNAELMEPDAYHEAEFWDDDDSDSFTVEWRMYIKSATIIETTTQIVKQVSNWRSAGITWVRLEPSNELSWERAKSRSLTDGTETHLVLKRLVIADDSPELIKRIGHETVNENLINDVMNNTNSDVNWGVSSEEPPNNNAEIGQEN